VVGQRRGSRVEVAPPLGALALLGWGLVARQEGPAHQFRKLRDRLLVLVGLLSFAAYFNFGSFHFGNYFHVWDTFHYYVGSKYFKRCRTTGSTSASPSPTPGPDAAPSCRAAARS